MRLQPAREKNNSFQKHACKQTWVDPQILTHYHTLTLNSRLESNEEEEELRTGFVLLHMVGGSLFGKNSSGRTSYQGGAYTAQVWNRYQKETLIHHQVVRLEPTPETGAQLAAWL